MKFLKIIRKKGSVYYAAIWLYSISEIINHANDADFFKTKTFI